MRFKVGIREKAVKFIFQGSHNMLVVCALEETAPGIVVQGGITFWKGGSRSTAPD